MSDIKLCLIGKDLDISEYALSLEQAQNIIKDLLEQIQLYYPEQFN